MDIFASGVVKVFTLSIYKFIGFLLGIIFLEKTIEILSFPLCRFYAVLCASTFIDTSNCVLMPYARICSNIRCDAREFSGLCHMSLSNVQVDKASL